MAFSIASSSLSAVLRRTRVKWGVVCAGERSRHGLELLRVCAVLIVWGLREMHPAGGASVRRPATTYWDKWLVYRK